MTEEELNAIEEELRARIEGWKLQKAKLTPTRRRGEEAAIKLVIAVERGEDLVSLRSFKAVGRAVERGDIVPNELLRGGLQKVFSEGWFITKADYERSVEHDRIARLLAIFEPQLDESNDHKKQLLADRVYILEREREIADKRAEMEKTRALRENLLISVADQALSLSEERDREFLRAVAERTDLAVDIPPKEVINVEEGIEA